METVVKQSPSIGPMLPDLQINPSKAMKQKEPHVHMLSLYIVYCKLQLAPAPLIISPTISRHFVDRIEDRQNCQQNLAFRQNQDRVFLLFEFNLLVLFCLLRAGNVDEDEKSWVCWKP
jgi:hypothetical protein